MKVLLLMRVMVLLMVMIMSDNVHVDNDTKAVFGTMKTAVVYVATVSLSIL